MTTAQHAPPAAPLTAERARQPVRRAAVPTPLARPSIAATIILLLLTVLMCSSHIKHGYFMADDWALRSDAHFAGFSGVTNTLLQLAVRRPVGALYFATIFTLIGNHITLMLSLAAFLHFLLSMTIYGVLRALRFAWLDAIAIASLALLFPSSDSTWLWISASSVTLAGASVLCGCLLNLHSMNASGNRRLGLRIAGLALIATGILTYELVAAIGLFSGALYFLLVERRRALHEWARDVLVLGAVLLVFTAHLIHIIQGVDTHEVTSVSQMEHHAHLIASQALSLLTHSILPFGTPRNVTVLSLLGALTLLGCAVFFLLRQTDQSRNMLLRWLIVLVAGGITVGLGYIALVPSNIYYVPLQAGIGNRVNAFAAVGYALIVYSGASLVGILAFRGLPHSHQLASGLAILISAVIGFGYLREANTDTNSWVEAGTTSRSILATLRTYVPAPAPNTGIVTLDAPLETSPGVPIFDSSWDLNGAVKLLWDDPSLTGYPMAPGMTVSCGANKLSVDAGVQAAWPSSYPVKFVDVASHASFIATNRSTCLRATTKLGVVAS